MSGAKEFAGRLAVVTDSEVKVQDGMLACYAIAPRP